MDSPPCYLKHFTPFSCAFFVRSIPFSSPEPEDGAKNYKLQSLTHLDRPDDLISANSKD